MHRLLLLVLILAACSKKPAEPSKLKKMDFKVAVDERGRMLPEIELYDQKHTPIVVTGSYTLTLSRPDNTVLCSVTRALAKTDYEKNRLKTDWQDASCPPDPAAEELRITLEVKTGDQPMDAKLTRDKTTPTKFVYRHLAAKPAAPATGSGSSAGSGDAKMVTPEAPAAEAPAAGSAAKPVAGPASGTPGSAAKPAAGSATKPVGSAGSDGMTLTPEVLETK